MTPKKITLIALALLFAFTLPAQSWRKLRKSADKSFEEGNYAQAGETYQKAWQKKQKKKELIFKAGESFYRIRDYRKAAEAYQHVKEKNDDYPLVGLKYARTLKQDRQYEKAIAAFKLFSESYTGDGKAILGDVVKKEVEGCQFAKNLPAQGNKGVELVYPSGGVNSDAAEFAPFVLTGEYFYFSSSMGEKARVYSSQRQGSRWAKAAIPGNFPVITKGQYCNANISPDGERLYFTICNNDKKWEGLNTRCEVFVSKKQGVSWSPPIRLPDFINMKGVTTTQPFSIHRGGQEVLYFASNREGGRGGLDIWYTTRDLGIDDNDFAFPVNLGPTINTLGDEISPFYHEEEETLYFASNGQVSMGGYDIFKSMGDEASWSVPINLGLPYNSGADDYDFVKNKSNSGGFLVSNRVFGGEKTNTTNDDIYEFTIGGRRITVKANAYNKADGEPLANYTVELYQLFEDGEENMLIEKDVKGSEGYLFELLANRTFRVQIASNGYETEAYTFSTNSTDTYTYGQPLFLQSQSEDVVVLEPVDSVDPTDKGSVTVDSGETTKETSEDGVTYTARGTSKKDDKEYVTSAPKHNGVYYKIQLSAVKKYKKNHRKIEKVKGLGRIDTEELVGENLTRILLGDFFTAQEATDALSEVKGNGVKVAFIVKYENGVRYGRVNMDD